MKPWPLRFDTTDHADFVFTDDSGRYFRSDRAFLERYTADRLTENDIGFLRDNGHIADAPDDLASIAYVSRYLKRINTASGLNYLILVPTLRCNLACHYCQVSRAPETARGFDWDEPTLEAVLTFLNDLTTPNVKIEFQGGEPLLRLDLLERVRAFCRERFIQSEFVVCTNLQAVSEQAWQFFCAADTFISTSFDGTSSLHQKQRTKSGSRQQAFEFNLDRALSEFGPTKVSAMPTIDPKSAPEPLELIRSFADLGFNYLFLRRVNHQGFARKRYATVSNDSAWFDYYRRLIAAMIEYNSTAAAPMEEYYLAHLVRRIVQGGHHNHVDLRNPNWFGADYLVVDFDGRLYPTDEARMVTRVGQIDLSIGHIASGVDQSILEQFNAHAWNGSDPDCVHCAFQPYCGLDPIDDLSRYGRIDLPRSETYHCRSHTELFRLAFDLIYSERPEAKVTLAHWLRVPRFSSSLAPRLA